MQLINECDETLKIDIEEKTKLAKDRFKDLIGDVNFEILQLKNHIVYEIKYSKSASLYTIYKLYNFVITKIDNKNILLNPKKLNVKIYNLKNSEFDGLISNAEYLIKNEDLTRYEL